MPKVDAKVLATKTENGAMLAKIQLNGKLPKVGERLVVKWGAQRSHAQNALLWAYYTWLINEANLKEHGFFCPEALHESLKAHFLADKIMTKGEWKVVEDGSTSIMTKSEFSEYVEKIDTFICDFFGVDTSSFWEAQRQGEEITGELTEEGKKVMGV
jgi:hypothetical protein